MKEQTTIGSTGEVSIKTTDKDGTNAVYVTLRVKNGQIADMFAKGESGYEYDIRNIKFSLTKKQHSGKRDDDNKISLDKTEYSGNGDDDNDECKCCSKDPVTGQVSCTTCNC